MLFNSPSFLFVLFPLILAGYYLLERHSVKRTNYLAIISLTCYIYWAPEFILLLIISIIINYVSGRRIAKEKLERNKKILLIGSVCLNLLILCYYKYVDFLIDIINPIVFVPFSADIQHIPLGISFFTFTQIAYLIDTYYGKVAEFEILPYSLLVTYFPHIAAGPILHHREFLPQFSNGFKQNKHKWSPYRVGILFIIVGLAKKVLIADQLSPYADLLFDGSDIENPTFLFSWLGSTAFTLQLYFDFSGYTDIAIGLSLLFGIVMPLNFRSPLKACNIIQFWQYWHMSLTRYIGEYVYSPISMYMHRKIDGVDTVKGFFATLIFPVMVTFLIVGVWHGAGWNFIVFGLFHGVLISINHMYRNIGNLSVRRYLVHIEILGRPITFACIVLGFVLFRATNIEDALSIYRGIFGLNGIYYPALNFEASPIQTIIYGAWEQRLTVGLSTSNSITIICSALLMTQLLPGTHLLFEKDPGRLWALVAETKTGAIAVAILLSLVLIQLGKPSPYLYANF